MSDALRVSHFVFGALVDEEVTFEEQGGNDIRHAELHVGHAGRLILPENMVFGDLRAVDDDSSDVVCRERPAVAHDANRIQCRMVARGSGIELEGVVHRFPAFAEAFCEFLPFDPLPLT